MLTKIDPSLTAIEAIEKAGLNWFVEPVELLAGHGASVPDHRAIFRTDTNKCLGVVGQSYQPIQNHTAFAFFDTIAERYGATYESAGVVKGGKKIFLQARLNRSFDAVRGGDPVECYITLVNSHDGSSSLNAFLTPIRLWCQNQLNNAIKNATTNVSLRHTATIEYRLRDALSVFNMATTSFDEFQKKAQYLAQKLVDKRMVEEFLNSIVPETGSTRVLNQREKIVELFESGKGNFGRSAWHLYNGATEWVDHYRNSDPDKALDSAMFGSGALLKGKAFEAALKI